MQTASTHSEAYRKFSTFGIILALFLSAMEISAVGPAAPMIVSNLGGLDTYSLLFTSYLLTSTVFMPLWGRASDRHGRKGLLLASLCLFLIGSVMAGFSRQLHFLIVARLIQGCGASGLIPLSFTAVSDMYTLEERTRLQGYLSATWGVASLLGPYIGGYLAENFGWRWVFLINLIPGLAAAILIASFHRDVPREKAPLAASNKSILASVLFVVALMVALDLPRLYAGEFGIFWWWFLAALFLLLFIYYERREAHPLIPLELYRFRIFTIGCVSGFFCSGVIIGLASYSPLYFQSVLGFDATASGLLLAPFSVAWVLASIPATRLMLRFNPRTLIIAGHGLSVLGSALFLWPFPDLSASWITVCMIIAGTGMAFNYPLILISTQHGVPRAHVGVATSALTWIRNQGATLFTAAMGTVLMQGFMAVAGSDLAPNVALMDPSVLTQIRQNPALRLALVQALHWVFILMLSLTVLAWIASLWLRDEQKEQTR